MVRGQARLDGAWRNLAPIALALRNAGLSVTEPSLSARLRDLHKAKFGAYKVERRRLIGGLWEYRIALALLLAFVLPILVHSEDIPDAPTPRALVRSVMPASPIKQPLFTKSELRDGLEILAVNVGDWWTTEHFLNHGGEEGELPTALVSNSSGFFAFKMAETGAEIFVEHKVNHMKFTRDHRWACSSGEVGVQLIVGMTARVDEKNYEYAEGLRALPPVAPILKHSPPRIHALAGGPH
jgi:hypothetical protein